MLGSLHLLTLWGSCCWWTLDALDAGQVDAYLHGHADHPDAEALRRLVGRDRGR